MKELRDVLQERYDFTMNFLKNEHPKIFEEQKHLDKGSVERAYWHYGYAMCLRDVLNQLPKSDVKS